MLPLIGDHVTMEWDDRTLLGTVVDVFEYGDHEYRVRVKHFNGQAWPCQPLATSVKVLDRQETK